MNLPKLLQGWPSLVLCLLAGATLPIAFAPVGFFPLAIVAPAILLAFWLQASPRRALLQGLLFGIASYGVGVSWVFISIHEFGNTSALLAAMFTFLFVLVLAIFTGLHGYLLRRLFVSNNLSTTLLVFPALWVLMEYLRSTVLTGFPWLLIAYSQVHAPLAGYIPILGEFGVGFLVLFSSALAVVSFKAGKKWFYPAIALIALWLIGAGLMKIQWTQPSNNKWYSVVLVQGNIPQELKWDAAYLDHTLRTYVDLTRPHWRSDIIIWPESAIPIAYQYVQEFIASLDSQAHHHAAALMVGLPMAANEKNYYNSVLMLGQGSGKYFKRHLVPFGEYLPFEKLLRGLIKFFDIPMSDFIAGLNPQANLTAADLWLAPFICYEIAYAEIVRNTLPQAQLLVTTSNDAWFGNSLAPWQHLDIGQFRALQTGRYMLFAGNSGVTAVIDPHGKTIAQVPQFKATVLTSKIQAMQGKTPWITIGTWPIIIFMLLMVSICFFRRK